MPLSSCPTLAKSKRFTDGEIVFKPIPAPGAVEADGDVVFFRDDVAKSDSAGGEQVFEVEIVKTVCDFTDPKKGDRADPLCDFQAVLALNGEHLFVLVLADGVAAEVAAAAELAEGVEGDVAVFELSHGAESHY